jgi:hypothetical protein
MANKEKLIECLATLTEEELALTMATGLDCKHCPVAQENGKKCYDKVVCFKNMMTWFEEEKMEETKYPEQIEIIWTVDDVLDMLVAFDKSNTEVLYRDLGMTRQEAAHVLHEVKAHHDANLGVAWDTLRYWIKELYGDKYRYNGEA